MLMLPMVALAQVGQRERQRSRGERGAAELRRGSRGLLSRRGLLRRAGHHAVRGRGDAPVCNALLVVRGERGTCRDRYSCPHGRVRLRSIVRGPVYAGESDLRGPRPWRGMRNIFFVWERGGRGEWNIWNF